MGYKTAFKEIMRGYQEDADRAMALKNQRTLEVEAAIPRIAEINLELSQLAFSAVKLVLEKNSRDLKDQLNNKASALLAEKTQLLIENGYPQDYLVNIYRCGDCKDTGYMGQDKCHCLRQRIIEKYYDISNLRAVLERENFDTFDLRYYPDALDPVVGVSPRKNIQLVYKACLDFVRSFDTEPENLFFYGHTGLGKTFLCNCIAKEILDLGKTVLYVTAPSLFKTIENLRFNRDEIQEPDEVIDSIYNVDLLIIDDLGTEFSTVITASELFDIINTRLLAKRPVIISSNLSPMDLEGQYSLRVVSRLHGNYKMLRFVGNDIRLEKKYIGR